MACAARWVLVGVLLAVSGCTLPSKGPRFRLAPEAPLPAAGDAEAVLEPLLGEPLVVRGDRDGTETFYYFDARRDDCRRGCVKVVVARGMVLSAQRVDDHPPWATEEGYRPGRPVSDGRVRLRQKNDEVLAALGPPTGVTAERGVEIWHYLSTGGFPSRVRIDGQVRWRDGVVVAFEERFVDGYDPRLPSDADDRPTSGRVHVGMSPEAVQTLLGEPDEVIEDGPDTLHLYTYPALFAGVTSDVTEQIVYRRGVVDGISTLDHTLAGERAAWTEKRANWSFLFGDDEDD